MTTYVVVTVLGAVGLVTSVPAYLGHGKRVPTSFSVSNYTALVLMSGAMLGLGLMGLLRSLPLLAGVLGLTSTAMLVLSMWAPFVRPPRWLEPRWQREMDEAERRAIRSRRERRTRVQRPVDNA